MEGFKEDEKGQRRALQKRVSNHWPFLSESIVFVIFFSFFPLLLLFSIESPLPAMNHFYYSTYNCLMENKSSELSD